MNNNFVYIVQIILGLSLIGLVILQAKGSGLGSTFGSSVSFYSSRRGVEKIIFILTIAVSVLFSLTSLIGVLL